MSSKKAHSMKGFFSVGTSTSFTTTRCPFASAEKAVTY